MVGGMAMGRSVAADTSSAAGDEALPSWTEQFAREVDHRLDVPQADQQGCILLLQQALPANADALSLSASR